MSRMITVSTYTARDMRPPAQWFTVASSALPDGGGGLPERWSNRVTITTPTAAPTEDRPARRAVSEWHPSVGDGVPLTRVDVPEPAVIEAWIAGDDNVMEPWWWFTDPAPVSTNTEFKSDPALGVVEVVREVWSEITR